MERMIGLRVVFQFSTMMAVNWVANLAIWRAYITAESRNPYIQPTLFGL